MTESTVTGSLAGSSFNGFPEGPLDDTLERELMEALRAREFKRLDENGQVYLDHTGSALYPESLIRSHSEWLCRSVLGNPHSRNPTSKAATEVVERARRRVLEFFNADSSEYEVIFTLNASGALKVVGEAYPFRKGSSFRLTADNHNSVNGIREFAKQHGAEVTYLQLGNDLMIDDLAEQLAGADHTVPTSSPTRPSRTSLGSNTPWSGSKRRTHSATMSSSMPLPSARRVASTSPSTPLASPRSPSTKCSTARTVWTHTSPTTPPTPTCPRPVGAAVT